MASSRQTPTASATVVSISQSVARMLGDDYEYDRITAGYTAAGGSLTVVTDATTRWEAGDYLDFLPAASTDTHRVTAVAATALTVVDGRRGSTAANHTSLDWMRKNPRFSAMQISDAVNSALDSDLFPEVFAVYEETLTAAPTTAYWYEVPTLTREVMRVYQKTDSTPTDLLLLTRKSPIEIVDTTLSTTGRAIKLPSLRDADNTIFAQCVRKMAVGDLTPGAVRVVEYLAAARLLEAKAGESTGRLDIPQSGTNAPGAINRDGRWFRVQGDQYKRSEKAELDRLFPRRSRNYFAAPHRY